MADVHLLILRDKVILDVGGETSGLVALSLLSGETIWKSKPYEMIMLLLYLLKLQFGDDCRIHATGFSSSQRQQQ